MALESQHEHCANSVLLEENEVRIRQIAMDRMAINNGWYCEDGQSLKLK